MIQTIYRFAEGIDALNWEKVKSTLAPLIQLDSTPVGRAIRAFTAEEFIDYMNSASGSFQATCHSVGNFRIEQNKERAEIIFDLMALHYLPSKEDQEVWTLFRTMKASMQLQDSNWVMTGMQTSLEQNAGNTTIMEQLQKQKTLRLPRIPGRNGELVSKYFAALQLKDIDKNIWTEDATWLMPFTSSESEQLSGKNAIEAYYDTHTLPTSISWILRNTQDTDISLASYQLIANEARVEVGTVILYCKNGLLQRVEDYRSPIS